ncbi:MAG: hypothetical protein JWP63_2436 [Candidatus Solibacter sp.]|jgi:hypothetical protein|nr:hypothetical protein [Candidatus Solibacter sp.]
MRFSKTALVLLLSVSAFGQKPVGFSGFVGQLVDYYNLSSGYHGLTGDTYYFGAWADDSLRPLFPDPTGLPVIGTFNDGHGGNACGGNIGLLQLSKLNTASPTSSNTLITPYPNCLDSYGSAPGAINNPTGWLGHLTAGDGHTDGTWKGALLAFRNGILLAPFYRQTSQGDAFGDATMALSPDAGNTWIDYSRYNTYSITGLSCSSSVVTLTVANGLAGNEKIYVHDTTPAGFGGKQTVTAATGSTVTYTLKDVFGATLACPASSGTGGNFGLLAANGSAPAIGGTMWVGGGSMGLQNIIIYGQDGHYPSGIEPACDPTVWVCGTSNSSDRSGSTVLWRVPVGREMDPTAYQWYSCAGYSTAWPIAESVCDGNRANSWTSTRANATVVVVAKRWNNGARPGECYNLRYLPSHSSYIMTCLQESYIGVGGRSSAYWMPHPWGPYYPLYNGLSTGYGAVMQAFFTGMPAQENIISTTPPRTQIQASAGGCCSTHAAEGTPYFGAFELGPGKLPEAGIARMGGTLGDYGCIGAGHRLVSGNMAGGVARRGAGVAGPYTLAYWFDLYDHCGDVNATSRPYFRDIVSGGLKYMTVNTFNGAQHFNAFNSGSLYPTADGVYVAGSNGYEPYLGTNFTDSVFTGNASWSVVMAVKPANTGGALNQMIHLTHTNSAYSPWDLELGIGVVNPGDLCVRWASDAAKLCTTGGKIAANQWSFITVTAQANGSGYPTTTIYVGSAGTLSEYGGLSLATSASGTTINGLTKTCSPCTTTPNIGANGILRLGSVPTGFGGFDGTYGEIGVYSGVVPSHVVREIYRTLSMDWLRLGRGDLGGYRIIASASPVPNTHVVLAHIATDHSTGSRPAELK